MEKIPNPIEHLDRIKKEISKNRIGSEYVKYAVLETGDTFRIFVLVTDIVGAYDEFVGGEYIAEIFIANDYPFTSPKAQFLTPNGVTDIDRTLYANAFGFPGMQDNMLGVRYVGTLLPAVLMQWDDIGNGIGILRYKNVENIKWHAEDSVRFNNEKLADIRALF